MEAYPRSADTVRQKVELAEVFARHGASFRATHNLAVVQQQAMRAIEACRTERLGGHIESCDACGQLRYHYHSCRNRSCPKCQTLAKERWLEARRAELLPVPYFHLVFTLPHDLNPLAQGNPRVIYTALFKAVAATLIEFGQNPRWLGGQIAATLVLHTWGQTLTQHLHLHCLVAAGALGADGQWISSRRGFLFPVTALSQVFRGKFIDTLARAFDSGQIRFEGSTLTLAQPAGRARFLATLYRQSWVVYAKKPFGGPQNVLDYLGRYTHRIAISNNRLLSVDETCVRLRYKDYADRNRYKVMRLPADEFIRRFLLHVLPTGFVRIRHYGLMANGVKRAKLALARRALVVPPPPTVQPTESIEAFWLRVANLDIHQCPHSKTGRMRVVGLICVPDARAPPKR